MTGYLKRNHVQFATVGLALEAIGLWLAFMNDEMLGIAFVFGGFAILMLPVIAIEWSGENER